MRYTLILLLFVAVACGSKSGSLVPSAGKVVENVTCPQSQSRLFDVLYASLVDLQTVPTESELTEAFQKALDEHPNVRMNQNEFLSLVSEFYQILLKTEANSPQEMLERLTALEVGDRTTAQAQVTQSELKAFEAKWESFTSQQDVTCSDHTPALTPSLVVPASIATVDFGARKVMATAYQSCSVLDKAPMTKNTPDVSGISRVGVHADGVGAKRQITDLASVQKTDYYLQNMGALGASCKDMRKGPLIYDYGGKPYTTSDPSSALDIFKNAGSGTSALGIDCSGYVFSSIASAGLKLDPAKKMKAVFVNGINARMYMDPVSNGMPCLQKVSMGVSGTVKSGDIAAIPGHVVIIDSVGSDPFGISKITTVDQCSTLTASKFNFVIAQSSPSKNGIGINRFSAADYLAETQSLRTGFEKYARDACKAKFQKKDALMQATNFQVVRHKLTPTCIDQPIALVGESCVSSCSSLVSSAKLSSFQERTE